MNNKDKESTKKATKQFGQIEDVDLTEDKLSDILYEFYPAIKSPKKQKELYSVQSLKCLHARLSHYFLTERGWDIIKGNDFVKANEIFKAICVNSKKNGKGVRKSYPKITEIDMEMISEYFNLDHMYQPDHKCLQRHLLFYIVYFFYRRGRENLYTMTQNTFSLHTEPTGLQYVFHVDEVDKNHGPEDTNLTNECRMYGNEGKIYKKVIFSLIL